MIIASFPEERECPFCQHKITSPLASKMALCSFTKFLQTWQVPKEGTHFQETGHISAPNCEAEGYILEGGACTNAMW